MISYAPRKQAQKKCFSLDDTLRISQLPQDEEPFRTTEVDIVSNFMLLNRDFALRCPWDNRLKRKEYLDFFIGAKQGGGRVGWTGFSEIIHRKSSFLPMRGNKKAPEEIKPAYYYWNLFLSLRGINRVECGEYRL